MTASKRVQATFDPQATRSHSPDTQQGLEAITEPRMPLPVKQWAQNMNLAAKAHTNASKRLLDLVLQARTEGYDPDVVSETVRDAFLASGCTEQSAKMRAAEARAIVNMPDHVIDQAVGGSVQTMASSARRIAKEVGVVKGRSVISRTGTSPLDLLNSTLATLTTEYVGNVVVASMLADMADMLEDLKQELMAVV